MNETLVKLGEYGIVPVVVLNNSKDAAPLADALCEGGLAMIKAVAAPYTMLKFMPTGGINPNNVKEYLKDDKIFACGGSWMVKGNLVDEGNFDEIKKLTKEAVDIVKEIRG